MTGKPQSTGPPKLRPREDANVSWVDVTRVAIDRTYHSVDLFSGAGGLTLGLRWAGVEPLLGVEGDPAAAATWRRNFPLAHLHTGPLQYLREARLIRLIEGHPVHLLCAGLPCQGISLAGRRDPRDARNRLYRQFVRVARILRPWFILVENVPGLQSLGGGALLESLVGALAEAGYPGAALQTLQAADFGVPQLRRRVIFLANRFDLPGTYPRPRLTPRQYVAAERAIDDLKSRPRDPSLNHEWTRHGQETVERLRRLAPGERLYPGYLGSWRRLCLGVPSPAVKGNHGSPHVHPELPRVISAREMARLQSFPDDFIFEGDLGQVMEQIGNAVPPLLGEHLGLALRPSLGELSSQLEVEPPGRADPSL